MRYEKLKKSGWTAAGILLLSLFLVGCAASKKNNCGTCPEWGTTDPPQLQKNG